MQYEPIKKTVGNFFNRSPFLRKILYHLLDLLLLRSWHIHRELNIWSKNNKGGAHILDAGAGFGQYTYYLSGLNPKWNILSVDVKQEQVAECNGFFQQIGRQSVLFKTEDLLEFQHTNSFDLILSVDVMEHIEEDVRVFQNFYNSIKPGGMLLISTPSDQGGSDVNSEVDKSFIDEHVRDGYSKSDIKEKLKSVGFSKVKVRYSYGKPGKISWLLSMKYPIMMLGFSKALFIILPFYYLITFPVSFVLNYLDSHIGHDSGTGLIVKAYKQGVDGLQ